VAIQVTITQLRNLWGELTRAVREQDQRDLVGRPGQSPVALISIDRFREYEELKRVEESLVAGLAESSVPPGVYS
jgi:hypothetical protein